MEVESSSVLVFRVGGVRYALPVGAVQEVIPLAAPVRVPDWPEPLLGLLNVRGTLVPLMDSSWVLDGRERALSANNLVVVLAAAGRLWGILVDAVEDVSDHTPEDARPMPTGLSPKEELVARAVLDANGPVVLLDPEVLVSSAAAAASQERG